ncbi:MAG: hypothetical protein RSG48_06550 [Clostridia bacterium]
MNSVRLLITEIIPQEDNSVWVCVEVKFGKFYIKSEKMELLNLYKKEIIDISDITFIEKSSFYSDGYIKKGGSACFKINKSEASNIHVGLYIVEKDATISKCNKIEALIYSIGDVVEYYSKEIKIKFAEIAKSNTGYLDVSVVEYKIKRKETIESLVGKTTIIDYEYILEIVLDNSIYIEKGARLILLENGVEIAKGKVMRV